MFKFSESADFLRNFRAGERAALEKVYFAYIDEVEAQVRRFLSTQKRGGIDLGDLVQEVFVRAFGEKARHAFDGERPYGPYLGVLTRNLMVDWARRCGRELPSEDLDRVPDVPPSQRDEWADRETMAAVNAYLAELSAELREVHEFRYVQCRSQDETCSALSISRQTLRTREGHLRDGLRRHLSRMNLRAQISR
ncbi:MAG: sigma-70 family RNA polymerase sigma factor [Polyangiaceae bacterium]